MLDLVQTIVSLGALLTAVYAIILQRRAMERSSKLNAAATLFAYYNAKIGSLRDSIIRDTNDRERAKLQPLEEREDRLDKLLKQHETMRMELERLYNEQL